MAMKKFFKQLPNWLIFLFPFILLTNGFLGKLYGMLFVLRIRPKLAGSWHLIVLISVVSVISVTRIILNFEYLFSELLIIGNLTLLFIFFNVASSKLQKISSLLRAAAITICFVVIFLKCLQLVGVDVSTILKLLRYSEIAGLVDTKYSEASILISVSERIGFGNPSDMGVFLFLTYLVSCAANNKSDKLFFILILSALFIAQSRTFLAGLVMVFFIWESIKIRVVLVFLAPIFVLLVYLNYSVLFEYLRISSTISGGDTFRLQLATIVYELIGADNLSWMFGVGYGGLKEHVEMLVGFRTTTESAVLTTIGTYGVLGGTVIILWSLRAFRGYLASCDSRIWYLLVVLFLISVVMPLTEYIYFYVALPLFLRLYCPRSLGNRSVRLK
jgi:hypothetical protein